LTVDGLLEGEIEMSPVYTIRSVEIQTQTAQPVFCLQCNKALIPAAGFALEVRNEHGTLGYLHPQGTCKAEWEKARQIR
jgi:hypothetical protein